VLDSSVVVYSFEQQSGSLQEQGWVGFAPDRGTPAQDAPMNELLAWAESHPSVHAFDVSADGRWLVAGSGKGTLGVWELTQASGHPARLLARTEGLLREVQALAFAPDGKHVVAGGVAGELSRRQDSRRGGGG